MNMVLYVKERFGLSNSAYHELSMVCQDLPRSWKLKDLTKKMNSKWDIKPCPGNDGVQQFLESRLKERVSHLLQEGKVKSGDTLQVKLSGDGTKVCRKLNINFAFTLLNEGEIAMSPKGNHTIAIINSTESYDVLATTLSDICDEVKRLTTVEVDNHTFCIEYFLCSDWKFLAIICGIESATATYACIWCKCPSGERYNMSKEWSITDPKKGARTIAEITACHTKAKSSSKRYSCVHPPLFPTIPLDHVIPDVLHLFLRVTDVLFNLLVTDIRRQDGIDLEELPTTSSMSKLETFFNDTCHIPFKFAICKETKSLKWRDLMGPEKLILLDKINLPILIPHLPNVDAVQALWKSFQCLHKSLHSTSVSNADADYFGTNAKKWVTEFMAVYQTKNVTPYIHLMAMHVPKFLKEYGNLVQFTQQGMEKLNDQTSIDFARSTNHDYRSLEALRQLMEKKNRIEYLEDHGFERQAKQTFCSLCHKRGHNR